MWTTSIRPGRKLINDPYQLHRNALAPLLPGATDATLEAACAAAHDLGVQAFTTFLIAQGLGPLWDARLESHADQQLLCGDSKSRLHACRLHSTGNYLLQRHSLVQAKTILDVAGVRNVVTKGGHVREVFYAEPALRPAQDIDILIHPDDRVTAIRAFQEKGFEFQGVIENIAQDCSLLKGNTAIDLHWDILRPGRTRQPIVEELLDGRVDYGSHWGMSHGATLFLMLVHPVFRKYSTTPYASLVRLVDLAKVLQQCPESAVQARHLLHTTGMTTAGWITATWLHLLTRDPRAQSLAATLRPGRLRQRYLYSWLATDRSTRLLHHPALIQWGFTLLAHDRLTDAIRALRQAWRCKRAATATLETIQKQVSCNPVADV